MEEKLYKKLEIELKYFKDKIKEKGFIVKDTKEGMTIDKI